jgi:hypothetical protein
VQSVQCGRTTYQAASDLGKNFDTMEQTVSQPAAVPGPQTAQALESSRGASPTVQPSSAEPQQSTAVLSNPEYTHLPHASGAVPDQQPQKQPFDPIEGEIQMLDKQRYYTCFCAH